ncbi:MAG: hypothetical protein Q9163_006452, partial [Psora crenata]
MLPTPSTSHVNPDRVYEPAEDSYLLLDTLSSSAETQFLSQHFQSDLPVNKRAGSPLVFEVGTGSGVVLAFITSHARLLFGRADVLALGSDINRFACSASQTTARQTSQEAATENAAGSCGELLTVLHADLASPLRGGAIDVLISNPPYVPSPQIPHLPDDVERRAEDNNFEYDSYLLSISYEGGKDGMEVTNRLLEQLPDVLNQDRGVAYILLCQQNNPAEVIARIRGWGKSWTVKVVGASGRRAGWEKLQ